MKFGVDDGNGDANQYTSNNIRRIMFSRANP